jgi:hypothetical protein
MVTIGLAQTPLAFCTTVLGANYFTGIAPAILEAKVFAPTTLLHCSLIVKACFGSAQTVVV